jgi:hypothetical protein
VQGVHRIKNPTIFEEQEPKNVRWARSIFFSRKSFEMGFSKSLECKLCVGDRKILQEMKLRRHNTFIKCLQDLEVGFAGGTKVKIFEVLKSSNSRKKAQKFKR